LFGLFQIFIYRLLQKICSARSALGFVVYAQLSHIGVLFFVCDNSVFAGTNYSQLERESYSF